jgi:hypothetical protein
MAISFTGLSGTANLDAQGVLKWLRADSEEVPSHIKGQALQDFLNLRTKKYGFLQRDDFIADFNCFYFTCRTLNDAISNMAAYQDHLSRVVANEAVACSILGVTNERRQSPSVQEALQRVVVVLQDLKHDEDAYVAECLNSLRAQLQWHRSGPVDKGDVPDNVRTNIEDQTLAKTSGEKKKLGPFKDKAKTAYYEPIRNRLMDQGFIVSPSGTALGAVFPESEWIDAGKVPFFERSVKGLTDKLVQKYDLVGDTPTALTRLLKPSGDRGMTEEPLVSAVGCVCVSWTRHDRSGTTLYIPILGLSGVTEAKPDRAFFERNCRHLGLPADLTLMDPRDMTKYTDDPEIARLATEILKQHVISQNETNSKQVRETAKQRKSELETEKKRRSDINTQNKEVFTTRRDVSNELYANYETMIHRTNLCAIQYRAREFLGMRRPSRQALMSYVSFREAKASKSIEIERLQQREVAGVDLWVCGWHSLNCAEPAALMCASTVFGEGCDVEICFPYEGLNDTGPFNNRPKETCAWCAAVELGFRSASRNPSGPSPSMTSGQWSTQITINTRTEPRTSLPTDEEFDAFNDGNAILVNTKTTLGGRDGVGLVKNKDLTTEAYSDTVQTKIGRIRSMYHLLGLMDPEVVALDRPLFAYHPSVRFG